MGNITELPGMARKGKLFPIISRDKLKGGKRVMFQKTKY